MIATGGHPHPVIAPPAMPAAVAGVSTWIILKAFASGCTAMTGVEAVSNGVRAFREPVAKTAQITSDHHHRDPRRDASRHRFPGRAYHVGATDPGSSGYQSVLSLLLSAVTGRGWFYWTASRPSFWSLLSPRTPRSPIFRACAGLSLRTATSPIRFPSVDAAWFSQGIYVLAILTALLLTIFGGITDRLIPLYAVGAFLAFTLSQSGMVAHWRKSQDPRAKRYMVVNGIGAIRDGPHGSRGAGRQVRSRRLDYGTSDSYI